MTHPKEQALLAALKAARQHRESLLAAGDPENLAPLRLVDGSGDNLPGLYIDLFGSLLAVHYHPPARNSKASHPEALARLELLKSVFSDLPTLSQLLQLPIDGVVIWQHLLGAAGSKAPEFIVGTVPDEQIIVEHGIKYLIKPKQQINLGFFIDMREVRARLLANSSDAQILNCFSFTGSLGLAALIGGAREVTQVDVSAAAHSWANQNLALQNPVPAGKMRCIKEDVRPFLARELRRVEIGKRSPYDTIIIDPPSFGHNSASGSNQKQKAPFRVQADLQEIVNLSLRLLASKGALILTLNKRGVLPEQLADLVRSENSFLSDHTFRTEEILPPRPDHRSDLAESISSRGIQVARF